ncbi:glycosyltransferase family 2 protein [Hymenobacter negativus]|uniref:Glycosyltransferase family 2 protein n=1 Tax=Hymenobacter negativus TaxID=2795026 RepID=A0ABS0Q8L9_9BACT|nr:glycosyltransferase family 2 protein [Hymenobacter negativus]MBH8559021.1 glycosyltransferase family 2 protein [Hymenobacter negativus]
MFTDFLAPVPARRIVNPTVEINDLVSIVVPVHNEQDSVRPLAEQIEGVMTAHGLAYELLLVNDGSEDQTWPRISALAAENPAVLGIDLAGNYGQTLSLRAGFERARGDIVVAMDGDLQHDPAYLPQFVAYIREGYDMVSGAKAKRPDGRAHSLLANTAHKVISLLSGVQLEYFGATYKAYRRYLLRNVELLGDSHRFLGALVAQRGIRYREFPIEVQRRQFGTSHYGLGKALLVVVDLVMLRFFLRYSRKPFRLFGVLGILTLGVGLLATAGLLVGSIFFGVNISHRFPMEFIFSLFLIMSGIFLICFGLLAEIGTHAYYARRNRAPYVVRRELRAPTLTL